MPQAIVNVCMVSVKEKFNTRSVGFQGVITWQVCIEIDIPLNNFMVVKIVLVVTLVTIAIYDTICDSLSISYREFYTLKPIRLVLHKYTS